MAHPRKADVLVADPEPVARNGLIHLINSHPELRVCAEAETLPLTRELCSKHKPAVLVLDPAMSDGFTFIKDLPRWSRGTRVVVFTGLNDMLSVQRAFKAGACGYITRHDSVASLMAAIGGALVGERHLGPRVQRILLGDLARGSMQMDQGELSLLSHREMDVFRLLGSGRGTRGVAEELRVSVKTVETHRQRIKQKLGLVSGAELLRRAVLFGGGEAGR